VTNLEQNEVFAAELENLVESHANDIPTMAKGCIFTLDSSLGGVLIRIFWAASRNVLNTCLPLKSAIFWMALYATEYLYV
jgi:hypothetical protein